MHSDTACTSCDQYKHAHTLTTGKKQKGKSPFWGRPRTSKAIAYIRDIAPSGHRPKNGTHEYLILDGLVELPCGNTVCANCLCEKLDQKREMVCPCCPTEHLLDHTHITPANTLVQKVLSNLTVVCVECGGLVKASAMEKHAEAKCQTHTMPIFPDTCTLSINVGSL